jgi:NADH dehydrogenase FAD-containing subunit
MRDLEHLRNAIKKYPKNCYVTVLGAGPNGLELAFKLAKNFKNVKIIEAMDKILPTFRPEMSELVRKELTNNNIELILNTKVTKVAQDIIHTDKSEKQKTDITIWTCGIKPNPFILKLTKDKFKVDSNFLFNKSIYAIGDIVASKELGPPTAQNAVQQGKHLAKHFNNNFISEPYEYKEKGKIIHTTDSIIIESSFGVFQFPEQFQPIIDFFLN